MAPIQATPGNTAVNGNGKVLADYTPFYFGGALFIILLMVVAPLWMVSTRGDDPNLILLIGLIETPLGLALAQIWQFIQTAEARKETAALARKQDATHALVNSGATAATETLKRVAYLEGRLEEREAQVLQTIKDEARRVSEINAEFVRMAASRGAVMPVLPVVPAAAQPPAGAPTADSSLPDAPILTQEIKPDDPRYSPPVEPKPTARFDPPKRGK